MKIAVIGAGISGLSFARLILKEDIGASVSVYEKSSLYGGIAKVRMFENIPYHMIGGHCLNSKYPEVMDFIFNYVLPKSEWKEITRKASINFQGERIGYPIEFSMADIYKIDPVLAESMVIDFIGATCAQSDNLEDWFINNFGESLARNYLIPYNKKIWNMEPRDMAPDWVEGKLPMTSKSSFVQGLLSSSQDSMPHQSFYYPKSGSQNTFINALKDGVKVNLDAEVRKVEPLNGGKYLVDGEVFDHVVYTGPLNEVFQIYDTDDFKVKNAASELKYNKVTTVLWKSTKTDDTWTYIPEDKILYHRLIHISNFIKMPGDFSYSISEAVGEVSFQDMLKSADSLSQLIEPLDYNVSDHAYVVFDKKAKACKEQVLDFFEGSNFHCLGRFGEWEYYNMDVCIKSSMNLVQKILKG